MERAQPHFFKDRPVSPRGVIKAQRFLSGVSCQAGLFLRAKWRGGLCNEPAQGLRGPGVHGRFLGPVFLGGGRGTRVVSALLATQSGGPPSGPPGHALCPEEVNLGGGGFETGRMRGTGLVVVCTNGTIIVDFRGSFTHRYN